MERYTETVRDVVGEMKIRDYLKKRLGLSTALIAKVKYDNVLLNGEIVHMRATVRNGDVIDITLPDEDSENIEPMNIALEILYEDECVIAVNKPKNMPVHPSRGNHLPTVANAIRAYIGHPFVFRAINRLDRDTSGIVLIAKDRISGAKLYQAMKDRKFGKSYIATVEGVPSENHGFINALTLPFGDYNEDTMAIANKLDIDFVIGVSYTNNKKCLVRVDCSTLN